MKDLAIVRYPRRGSAKAIKSALNLYFHSRARAARILALSIVICLIPPFGSALEPRTKVRRCRRATPMGPGRAPGKRCRKSNYVCARATRSKGDVLFEMDADDFAIDVRIAQSELDEARARLRLAEDASAARPQRLLRQNATAQQLAPRRTEIEVEIARANVAHKEGALAKSPVSPVANARRSPPSREPSGGHM